MSKTRKSGIIFSFATMSIIGLESLIGCSIPSQTNQTREQREAYYVEGLESIKWMPHLIVNTDSAIKTGRIANTQEGIEDIKELALTAEAEEVWCQLPQSNHWVEVGSRYAPQLLSEVLPFTQSEGMIDGFVKVNNLYLSQIINKNKINLTELRLWHLRPKSTEEKVSKTYLEYIKKQNPSITEQEQNNYKFQTAISTAIPSHTDYRAMLSRAIDIWKQNTEMNYSEAFCSSYGIITLAPTEQGIIFRSAFSIQELTAAVQTFYKTTIIPFPELPAYLSKKDTADKEVENYIKTSIELLCKQMNNQYINISFTPNFFRKKV